LSIVYQYSFTPQNNMGCFSVGKIQKNRGLTLGYFAKEKVTMLFEKVFPFTGYGTKRNQSDFVLKVALKLCSHRSLTIKK
jgi:hypothetical protein